jgi:hypothetical protein
MIDRVFCLAAERLHVDESVCCEPALRMGGEKLLKGTVRCARLLEIDPGHAGTLPQFPSRA